jgi:hypothetical protein
MPDLSGGLTGPIIEPRPAANDAALAVALAGALPTDVRLGGARAIANQQKLECCVSCALATCLEVLRPSSPRLSPLFHYYMTFAPSVPNPDTGMSLEQGLGTVASTGVSSEILHSVLFDLAGVQTKPSAAAIADGETRRLPFNQSLERPQWVPISLNSDPVNSIKRQLAAGFPILAGIHITTTYGANILEVAGTRTNKRHAVALLGYSDAQTAFIVQDSRGPEFALGGQWWLKYQMLVCPEPVLISAIVVGV